MTDATVSSPDRATDIRSVRWLLFGFALVPFFLTIALLFLG